MTVVQGQQEGGGRGRQLAIDLATGNKADAASVATASVTDTQTNAKVASVLLTPEAITKANVEDVVTAGAATAARSAPPSTRTRARRPASSNAWQRDARGGFRRLLTGTQDLVKRDPAHVSARTGAGRGAARDRSPCRTAAHGPGPPGLTGRAGAPPPRADPGSHTPA